MIRRFCNRKLQSPISARNRNRNRNRVVFADWIRFSQCGFSSKAPNSIQRSSNFNSFEYADSLRRCVQNGDVKAGMGLHCDVVKRGNCLDLFAFNIILNLYAKNGLLFDARKLFDEMPERNTVSFVTLMRGYGQGLRVLEGMELFVRIHREGYELNPFAFTTILKLLVSADLGDLSWTIHACVLKLGHGSNAFVGTCLMDSYSVCRNVDGARKVFDGIVDKDMVSWNGLLDCYTQNNCFEEALHVFSDMRTVSYYAPCNFTFAGVLKACVGMEAFGVGQGIHGYVVKTRSEVDHFVGIGLLDLYTRFGGIRDARLVFDGMCKDRVIPWSFMIARYAQNGQSREAVELFCELRRCFVVPNQFTYASALQACATKRWVFFGSQIHCHVIKVGYISNVFVTNALIDVYAKCGLIENSMDLFLDLSNKNDVSWNTMIVGYTQIGNDEKALRMFIDMLRLKVQVTRVTFSSVLRACASLASLEPGLQIHSLIYKTLHDKDVVVENSLIDMYAKCGRIRDARLVFDSMNDRDLVSWNTMISGYSMHGLGDVAIRVYETMLKTKHKPDKLTFIAILSACSNAGLLIQGRAYFNSMVLEFGMEPCTEHYTCMVLLLGRSGHLEEAVALIEKIPFEQRGRVWRALLGACMIHNEVELGSVSADRVLKMAPEDEVMYLLLSDIHARAKNWASVAAVRKSMKEKGVKKETGLSWIENNGVTHSFTAKDSSHCESRVIFGMLDLLNVEMKRVGFVPGLLDVQGTVK